MNAQTVQGHHPQVPAKRERRFWTWLSLAVLALSLAGLGFGLWEFVRAIEIGSWPRARGQITASDVTSEVLQYHINKRGETSASMVDRRYVTYGFQLGDEWYTGRHRSNQPVLDAARYAVGQVVDVYYDPDAPARNALEARVRAGAVVAFLSGAGLLLGLMAARRSHRRGSRRRQAAA